MNNLYKHVKGTPYPQELRELVLAEHYRGISFTKLALKYNIKDSSIISHWIRTFEARKTPSSLPKIIYRMPRKKSNRTDYEQSLTEEIVRLKKELSHKDRLLVEQNKRAERSELKNELLSRILDIAEEELNIDIRKKSGPKQ